MLFMLRLFENLFSIHLFLPGIISIPSCLEMKCSRREIMILLKSLTVLFLLRLLKNLFSIHFSSSQDNQYPRCVEIKMLAFQKAFCLHFGKIIR